MTRLLVASDWHLGPRSPALHARLAGLFLARARAAGDRVVLNGDVFEVLFSGPGRAEAAHPEIVQAIGALAADGRLLRTSGNHDAGSGTDRLVLDVAGAGRVLVAHGHAADPVSSSPIGRLGDAISRRFGRLAPVRGAAALVERICRAAAEDRMLALFRRRCLALVAGEGADLGVFGHVHVPHLVAGDRYANAGGLVGDTLSYLALGPGGASLETLRPADLADAGEVRESNPGRMR